MVNEAIKVTHATGALDYRTLLRDVTDETTQDVELTPLDPAADSEFSAWVALSDEAFDSWEESLKKRQ